MNVKFNTKNGDIVTNLVRLANVILELDLNGSELAIVVSMIKDTEPPIAKSNRYKLIRSLEDKGVIVNNELIPHLSMFKSLTTQDSINVNVCLKELSVT